jgi:hypothetical protein
VCRRRRRRRHPSSVIWWLARYQIGVKIRNRQLGREYQPYKNNQEVTGLTVLAQVPDFFKLLNNANMFL